MNDHEPQALSFDDTIALAVQHARRQVAIKLMTRYRAITEQQLAAALRVPRETAQDVLDTLVADGTAEKGGFRPAGLGRVRWDGNGRYLPCYRLLTPERAA